MYFLSSKVSLIEYKRRVFIGERYVSREWFVFLGFTNIETFRMKSYFGNEEQITIFPVVSQPNLIGCGVKFAPEY